MKDILFIPVSSYNSNNATTETTVDREKEEICKIINSLTTLTRDELLEFCKFKVKEGVKLRKAYLGIQNANYSLTKTMAKYRHQLHQLTSMLKKINLRPTRFNSSLRSVLNNLFEDIKNEEMNNDLHFESSDIMNLHIDRAKIGHISDPLRLKSNTPCSESNAISAASNHINSKSNASNCLGSRMSTAVPVSNQLFPISNATSIAKNPLKSKPNILSRSKLNTIQDTATPQDQKGSNCGRVILNPNMFPNKKDLRPAVIISKYLKSFLNGSKKKTGLNFALVSPNCKLKRKRQNAKSSIVSSRSKLLKNRENTITTIVSPSSELLTNEQNTISTNVSSSSKLVTDQENTNSAFISSSSKLIISQENTISTVVSPSSELLTKEQNTYSTFLSPSSMLVTNQQTTNSTFISPNSKLISRENTISAIVSPSSELLTNEQNTNSTFVSPNLKQVTNQQNVNSAIVSSSSKLVTNQKGLNSAFVSPNLILLTKQQRLNSAIASPSSELLTNEQNTNSTFVSPSLKQVTNQQNMNSAIVSSSSKLVTNQKSLNSPFVSPNLIVITKKQILNSAIASPSSELLTNEQNTNSTFVTPSLKQVTNQQNMNSAIVSSSSKLVTNQKSLNSSFVSPNPILITKRQSLNSAIVSSSSKLVTNQKSLNSPFVSPNLIVITKQQRLNSAIASPSSELLTNEQNTNSTFVSPSLKQVTNQQNMNSAIVSSSSKLVTNQKSLNSSFVSPNPILITKQQRLNSAIVSPSSKLMTNQQGSISTIKSPNLKANATLLKTFSTEFVHKNKLTTIASVSASPFSPDIQEEMTDFINPSLKAVKSPTDAVTTVTKPLLQNRASSQTDDIIGPQNVIYNITNTHINRAKVKIFKSTQRPTDLTVSNTVTSQGLKVPLENITKYEMPVRLTNPPLKTERRLINIDLDKVITQGLPSGLTTSANKSDNSWLVVEKLKPGDNLSSPETNLPDYQNQITNIPSDDAKIKICGSLVRVDDPPAEIKIRAEQVMAALKKQQTPAPLNTSFKTNTLLRPANLHKIQGLPSGLIASANKPVNSYLVVNKRKLGDDIPNLAINGSPTKKLATETNVNAQRTVIPNNTSAMSPGQGLFEGDTSEASGNSYKNITDTSYIYGLIAEYEKTLTDAAKSITFDWSQVKLSKKTQGRDSVKVVETPFKTDQCDSAIVKDTLKPQPTMSMTTVGESVDDEDFLKPKPNKSIITFSAAGQACVIKRLNDKKAPNLVFPIVEDTPERNSETRVSRIRQASVIKRKSRPLDIPQLLDET